MLVALGNHSFNLAQSLPDSLNQSPNLKSEGKPLENVLPRNLNQLQLERAKLEILRDLNTNAVSTLNYILSGILTVLTIVGVVGLVAGFKGLREIRESFKIDAQDIISELKDEVENQRNRSASIDGKIAELDKARKKAEENFLNVEEFRKEIDLRVELLGYKQKIPDLIYSADLNEAGKIIEKALLISSDDSTVLNLKGTVSLRKGDLSDEERQYRKALKSNPNHLPVIVNIAEILLLRKDISSFNDFLSTYESKIRESRSGLLELYFLAFRAYLSNDENKLQEIVDRTITQISTGLNKKFNWEFIDVYIFMTSEQDNDILFTFRSFVDVLSGKVSKEAFLE